MENLEKIKEDIDQIKDIIKQIYNHIAENELEEWETIGDIEKCNIGDCTNMFDLVECVSKCRYKHCKKCKKDLEIECCKCNRKVCKNRVEITCDQYPTDGDWSYYGPKYLCYDCKYSKNN